MNSKLSLISLLLVLIFSLSACGGGEVSEFSDDDLPSPVGDGGDGSPSDPGADPVDGEALAELPRVSAGKRIFADPNVLIQLAGSAEAAADATIALTRWTQVAGPSVVISNPNQLSTDVVIPDLLEEALLVFRLTAVDSEGRINSARLNVVVKPSPAFARVIGEVVEVDQQSATFTVLLNTVQAGAVAVNYQTQDGTAVAGIDYENTSGTLMIPSGEVSATIAVPILAGGRNGVDQSFSMRISVISADGQNYSANVGVALLRDTPAAANRAPQLLSPDLLTLLLNIPVSFALENQGGVGISSCEIEGDFILPAGLSLSIAGDASTCVISGTPVEVQQARLVSVLAVNDFGESRVAVSLAVTAGLSPPLLADIVIPALQLGEQLAPQALNNSGGGDLINCSAGELGLPQGLVIAVSEDLSTCILSGTAQEGGVFTASITAENAAGVSNSVSIGIEILVPPVFVPVSDQILFLSEVAEPIVVSLLEGSPLVSCEASPELPEGLSLALATGNSACVITGSPSAASPATDYTISGTNAAGTADETVSIAVEDLVESLNLSQALFEADCGIGVALNGGVATINWNDGSTPEQISNGDPELIDAGEAGALAHILGQEIDGVSLSFSRGLSSLTGLSDNGCAYDINVNDLAGATNLEVLKLSAGRGRLNGQMADLARNHPRLRELDVVRTFSDDGGISFTGLLSELPPNIERFRASLGFSILQDELLNSVPASLQDLDLESAGSFIGGDIENLPQSLIRLRVADANGIGGDLAGLREDMELLELPALNSVSGDVSTITNQGGLDLHLFGDGETQISATVATIPSSITSLVLDGSIPVDGSIADLHPDMSRFLIFSELAAISGDIAQLQTNGPIEVAVLGGNTIFGDIQGISPQLIALELGGLNRLTGNIETMPSNIERFVVSGANSLTGDIGLLSANSLVELSIGGANTISTFSASPTWTPENLRVLELFDEGQTFSGFVASDIDAILNYFNALLPAVIEDSFPAVISLQRPGDEAPTEVSASAEAELRDKGFSVLLNDTFVEPPV